jgi:Lrp/AsnC family transcriptional regulator
MLDPRDRQILTILQADSETPVTAIADRLGLSVSACSRRIQRLREDGAIARCVAVLDRKRMGVPTTVFVLIRSGRHAADWVDGFRAAIADVPEIVEAHRLTGNFDYMLKIVLPNVEYYDVVYKRLTRKLELFDVAAYISMETLKLETMLPTDHAP